MNLQDMISLDEKRIRRRVQGILRRMHQDNANLSIVFVSDEFIKSLNLKYLGVNSPTDVLAFSMGQKGFPKKMGFTLGDIVISAETALRESQRRKIPLQRELDLYIIHGILHILGYDDRDAAGRKKMREKEEEFLR